MFTSNNYGERNALLSNRIDDLSGSTSTFKKKRKLCIMFHDIKEVYIWKIIILYLLLILFPKKKWPEK